MARERKRLIISAIFLMPVILAQMDSRAYINSDPGVTGDTDDSDRGEQTYRYATTKERRDHRLSNTLFAILFQKYFLKFPGCVEALTKVTEAVGANTTEPIEFFSGKVCSQVAYRFLKPLINPVRHVILGRGPDYTPPVYTKKHILKIPTIKDVYHFVTNLG